MGKLLGHQLPAKGSGVSSLGSRLAFRAGHALPGFSLRINEKLHPKDCLTAEIPGLSNVEQWPPQTYIVSWPLQCPGPIVATAERSSRLGSGLLSLPPHLLFRQEATVQHKPCTLLEKSGLARGEDRRSGSYSCYRRRGLQHPGSPRCPLTARTTSSLFLRAECARPHAPGCLGARVGSGD